jgi:hypothetical protein
LSHLYIKCIILPRQARDKHRESSKKCRFLAGIIVEVMLEIKIQAAKREAEAAEWCEDRTWIFCDATLNAKNAIILPRQARDKHT